MPTISKDDLFRAILAMDVYYRDYNSGSQFAVAEKHTGLPFLVSDGCMLPPRLDIGMATIEEYPASGR